MKLIKKFHQSEKILQIFIHKINFKDLYGTKFPMHNKYLLCVGGWTARNPPAILTSSGKSDDVPPIGEPEVGGRRVRLACRERTLAGDSPGSGRRGGAFVVADEERAVRGWRPRKAEGSLRVYYYYHLFSLTFAPISIFFL